MTQASSPMDCVPFVNTPSELTLAKSYFAGAAAVRVSLAADDSLLEKSAASGLPLWLDPSIDGFHHIARKAQSFAGYAVTRADRPIRWMERYSAIESTHKLGSVEFIDDPEKKAVGEIVGEVLKRCARFKPKWVSVPQFPLSDDASRNKINLALAKAAGATTRQYELVLPAIFTHRRQTAGKTQWRKKVEQVLKCAKESNAKHIWVVDTTLDDNAGRPSDKVRLSELLEMHKFIRSERDKQRLKSQLIVGPYWGFNLSLWSRGLADRPAVPLGMSASYTIPGLPISQGKVRLMLNCLKRKCDSDPALFAWLKNTVTRVESGGDAFKEFSGLIEHWAAISIDKTAARRRTAQHYSKWVADLQALPPSARALNLFQIFSGAYVLGTGLPDLPESAQPARRPGQIAEHLMLTCLS